MDEQPPRRRTRPGELPPPPRVSINRIEDQDDEYYADQRDYRRYNNNVVWLVILAGIAAVYALFAADLQPYTCALSRTLTGVQSAECPVEAALPDMSVAAIPTAQPNTVVVVITPTTVIRDKGAILIKTRKLSDLLTYQQEYNDQITMSQAASSAQAQALLNWAEQLARTFNYDVQQHGRDTVIIDFYGRITYGVSLDELTEDYISISPDQQQLKITLPPSKVLSVDVDVQKSRVIAREQGFLAQSLMNIDIEALQTGRQLILQKCTSEDMVAAAMQAKSVLEQILTLSDFQSVEIVASAGSCSTTLP